MLTLRRLFAGYLDGRPSSNTEIRMENTVLTVLHLQSHCASASWAVWTYEAGRGDGMACTAHMVVLTMISRRRRPNWKGSGATLFSGSRVICSLQRYRLCAICAMNALMWRSSLEFFDFVCTFFHRRRYLVVPTIRRGLATATLVWQTVDVTPLCWWKWARALYLFIVFSPDETQVLSSHRDICPLFLPDHTAHVTLLELNAGSSSGNLELFYLTMTLFRSKV